MESDLTVENNICSLKSLFNNAIFRIPQYQRAYSWDIDPNLVSFLDDLRQQVAAQKSNPDKQYFLGTLLLHETKSGTPCEVHIVDGQQRLTTSVIFIATAISLFNDNLIILDEKFAKLTKRSFIYDIDAETQKFHTISEDEPYFRANILGIAETINIEDSPSSHNIKAAKEFFNKFVENSEWQNLIDVLVNARVMVYVVNNPAEATQIFELQNDRGKRLTDLEALKSYLMHSIYLQSKNPDDHLSAVQTQFSKIYRCIEELGQIQRTPDEDAILSYHCAAFLDWQDNQWRNPKRLVKKIIQNLDSKDVVMWIEEFTNKLQKTFKSILTLFIERDKRTVFAELIILNRMAPFWPIILKTWELDRSLKKQEFEKVCRLLEVYAFKGYAISNIRSDSGLSTLYSKARDFKGDYQSVFDLIYSMCSWYNLDRRFKEGLDNPELYTNKKRDALYLLWKYENSLRQKPGRKQPALSWRDFIEPKSFAVQFSIEHVASQNNPIVKTIIVWDDQPEMFSDVALNRLGNLVIDSVSPNAAKGKKDLAGKLIHLIDNSIYLSQAELIKWVEEYNKKGEPLWESKAVKKRHNDLIEFAEKRWNPSTYHKLQTTKKQDTID